ncbi:deoxyribonuclease TATDN1 [Hetaerina americana]|uniref:deoxyribonuclease TATDN1 n=1 Tax=Hetaerina americana TaxID=62018 RepID=UPI003A7F5AEA
MITGFFKKMSARKMIDIGANLTDPMFQGIYNGTKKHEGDLNAVLERAWNAGVDKIIVTGGSLEDCKAALKIAKTDEKLYSTVGVHPTRCEEFEAEGSPENHIKALQELVEEGVDLEKVIAIGECGLDYDRLKFCPKETQLRYFEKQLALATHFNLPLFLHCRNAASDLVTVLSNHRQNLVDENKEKLRGVVHSFDGTSDEAQKILDLGFFIGINGCSLKTDSNLETLKSLPSDKILIETDSPWCEPRPTHAWNSIIPYKAPEKQVKKEKWVPGCTVKGRNEPGFIGQILDIIAATRGEDADNLCNIIHENTMKLFFK